MKMLQLFGKEDFKIFYNIFRNGNVNNPKFIQQGFLRNDFLDKTDFLWFKEFINLFQALLLLHMLLKK